MHLLVPRLKPPHLGTEQSVGTSMAATRAQIPPEAGLLVLRGVAEGAVAARGKGRRSTALRNLKEVVMIFPPAAVRYHRTC